MSEQGQAKGGGWSNERSAAGEHNPWVVAIIVSMATFMEVMDISIANVSLQHIAGSLSADQAESTWVLTSYLVSNAIVLPVSGWLARVVGRKRFYMGCIALFGASSLLCGLAPTLGLLVFFRVLQGLGGGGLAPSEQSILADTFPPAQRGQAFALYGIAVVVAPTLGPTLGGWITDHASWRWVFLINVPICVLSLFLSGWILNDPPVVRREREELRRGGLKVDYLGCALVAVGLGCLQVVLDKGTEDDWFASDFILAFAIVSAISLVALVIWELGRDDPIVDIPLFKDRSFAATMATMFLTGFILISTTQVLPQFMQSLMGYTATEAGMALTAGGLATLVVMPLVGTALKKFQPKHLIAFGLMIEAVACWHLRGFTTDITFAHVAWARVLQAVGLPFLFVPISTVAYAGLPPGKSNNASALVNTMRNLGGSFGISVAVMLLAQRGQLHHERIVSSADAFTPAGVSAEASPAALRALQQMIERQAAMASYIDIFLVLAIAAAVAAPVVLLLLRQLKPEEAAAGH
ncbi:MAG TPA: DHA2 family efflux MFS transporter permease subunit [Opitutus sp.]|nr:DHA2 family efflux MFS transporter permease subunit [Opitutus sp.]